MAVFNKVNGFVEHLAEGVHDLQNDAITCALSNTAPASETPDPTVLTADAILANVTEIVYTNLSSRLFTVSSSTQTGGTLTVTLADLILTASGGSVGPFRYVYIFNDTPSAPADPLIGYYDYGSALTLADGESFTIDFTSGLLTLT